MTAPLHRAGGAQLSAWTNRKRCRPAVAGFFVDKQAPHKPLSPRKWECSEVDPERHPELTSRSDTGGSTRLELPVQADWIVSNGHRVAILIGQIEAPLVFDVGLIPRHRNSHSDRHLLRSGADHSEPTTENEQLAIVYLDSISHQDDGAEGWRVEREVGLIHEVDLIGRLSSTGFDR